MPVHPCAILRAIGEFDDTQQMRRHETRRSRFHPFNSDWTELQGYPSRSMQAQFALNARFSSWDDFTSRRFGTKLNGRLNGV
jgi:hypothetical protein